ncbi:MAG: HIT family protein [Candidatus Kerfeldbacteria bacterium]|nr:HIT family protein [Candidatus Kerfeldbacteria bacterium]
MTDCLFCRIVAGDEPRHHVWEDDEFIAILDRKPVNPGHTLIIPKAHTNYLFALPPDTYSGLFLAARRLEPALKRLTGAPRIGLAVEGFGVDHVHLHVIPLFRHGDIDPHRATPASEEDLLPMAEQLRQELAR